MKLLPAIPKHLLNSRQDGALTARRMDMFIDPIVEKYDEYTWYDVDRDVLPEIADKYDVMGIPSLLIFQNGEKQAHLHSANAKSPAQVTEFLEGVKA